MVAYAWQSRRLGDSVIAVATEPKTGPETRILQESDREDSRMVRSLKVPPAVEMLARELEVPGRFSELRTLVDSLQEVLDNFQNISDEGKI